jgi:hypothetical protein
MARAPITLPVAGALALAFAVPAGAEEHTTLGPGAWSYFGDPRSVHVSGTTYTGAITPKGHVVVYATRGVHRVDRVVLRRRLGPDDHNNPSLHLRPDGRLQVFYSPHSGRYLPRSRNSQMHYRIERRAGTLRFGPERSLRTNTPGANGYTYPNPLQAGARTWLFWRGGNWFPSFSTSRDGLRWSRARTLVSGPPEQRPYAKYVARGDTIHAAFSHGHVRSWENSLYYLAIRGDEVRGADGRVLARVRDLPLALDDADPVYGFVPQGGRAWPHDVAVGRDGLPVIVYTLRRGDTGWGSDTFYYARFNGHGWISRPIVWAGRKSPTYTSGGATLDHEDPNIVYLSRRDGEEQVVEIWRTGDDGETWTHRRIAAETGGRFAMRPVSPRGLAGRREVLWMAGSAKSYTDYRTGLRLSTGTGGVTRQDPAGTVNAPYSLP